LEEYEKISQKAYQIGKQKYPGCHPNRHAAFANSVAYLVTGFSGGALGPSMREHAVSWALVGDGDRRQMETFLGETTVVFPDSRITSAGAWSFENACNFAEPIIFGTLHEICKIIVKQEYCFDDDPADLEKMRGKL
jgi:hypothetical protein